MKVAWLPVLVFRKATVPVELVVIVELPAVLETWKAVTPVPGAPPLLVMLAVPAVELPLNVVSPFELMMMALPAELMAFVLLK